MTTTLEHLKEYWTLEKQDSEKAEEYLRQHSGPEYARFKSLVGLEKAFMSALKQHLDDLVKEQQ